MAIKIQQAGLQNLLASPSRMIGDSENVLTYLFRSVLLSRGITMFLWNKRLRAYFNREPDRDPNNDRGNLNKQLTSAKLSWAAFKKAIDFLRPRTAHLTFIVFWKDKTVTQYTIVIDPREKEDDLIEQEADLAENPIINKPDRNPPSVLARLFRTILVKRGITEAQWENLLQLYVEQTAGSKGRQRNSIDRDLRNPRITFTVFRQGMIFLQAQRIEYQLELMWKPGDISIHTAKPEGC